MASMRKAINAKCKDCTYDPQGVGTWREQVQKCTSKDCALYPLRPRSASNRVSELATKTGKGPF